MFVALLNFMLKVRSEMSMKLKSLCLGLAMLISVTTVSNAFAMTPPNDIYDFNKSINKDLINQYGEWKDEDSPQVIDARRLLENKANEEVQAIAKKVGSGEIVLDKSPTSETSTIILKYLYCPETFLEDEDIQVINERDETGEIVPDISSTIDTSSILYNKALIALEDRTNMYKAIEEVINYMTNHDERLKGWPSKIKSLMDETIQASDDYIDSMPLSDLAKTKMKETINSVNFVISDEGLQGYFFDFNPHFHGCKNIITIPPVTFLLPLFYDTEEASYIFKITFAHELGHAWNYAYVLEEAESEIYHKTTFPMDDKKLEEAGISFYNNTRKVNYLQYLTDNDKKFLSENANKIIEAFNIKGKESIDQNGQITELDINIDGRNVFIETAADNFALESISMYEKNNGNDVYKVFSAFAKNEWGVEEKSKAISQRGWDKSNYPAIKYRINAGLNLCKAYRDWLKSNNVI